ncbi:MAG: YcbK family protein [Granulosicoccus sp.]
MNPTNKQESTASRRRFLRKTTAMGLVAGGFGIAGFSGMGQALAATEAQNPNETSQIDQLNRSESRRLHVVNAHTWEDLDVVYYTHGIHIDENIAQLNHLMRDRRANVARPIDTALYDQLYLLSKILDTSEGVHVLSGYRTPETNAKLRRRSSGVAKYSLHMEGRAADIYFPGVSAKELQQAALTMQAGGVGLYSKSNFVHVDTGQIRNWGS